MGVEFDPTEVIDAMTRMKEAGPRALGYLVIDFGTESVRNANIDKGHLRSSIQPIADSETTWHLTNIEYTSFVHDGHLTRPAIKHPEKSEGQRWVQGNPFFEDAADTVKGNTEEYITMAMEDLS